MGDMSQPIWSMTAEEALGSLKASADGLSSAEARQRLATYGANLLKRRERSDVLTLLLGQFKSPIILILIGAALLSAFLGDKVDTIIILAIVLVSALLGFWQERGAAQAVEKLLAIVEVKTKVVRDGQEVEIPVGEVVPGDVVVLDAGDVLPGDCVLLEAKDLYINEAALTGETFPVEKAPAVLPADTPLAKRTNVVYMGTNVVSGSAHVLVYATGTGTEFGKISETLKLRPPETEFEHGVKHFGFMLMEVTFVMLVLILAFNVYEKRPVLDSLLFAMALAVGLTPQLLPAIISINLAAGARRMAEVRVIVKRLSSIDNFGSMTVFCSDKTGTLTEGVVHVKSALDPDGHDSEQVLLYAYINATYETGFTNPIDEAIRDFGKVDLGGYRKLDEVPYDFLRKRLSILVATPDGHNLMVTKGALDNVLAVCTAAAGAGHELDLAATQPTILSHYEDLSRQGFRVLGVAFRDTGDKTDITKDDEAGMTFAGFLVLYDPLKENIRDVLAEFTNLGIALKIITGDNALVAARVCEDLGIENPVIVTGTQMRQMSEEALRQQVGGANIFAEVEPNQKQRIILALRKSGQVVGFMGDGINDAPALHAADVSISVNTGVDVAKDAADIVLLDSDLRTLIEGVRGGRITIANTLKYMFMATSANFGNMFSMAGASLFLPFLPLLPKQILLTNLLTDFPEMTISTDNTDPEMVDKPTRWNIDFIRKFMLVFGPLSSVFDYATFAVLLYVLHATEQQFRTGWFMESVISAALIVLVVRTRRPFLASRPSKWLAAATAAIVAATFLFPYTALAGLFGFAPLPLEFIVTMGLIVVAYILAAELAKAIFYRKVKI